jgi:hypothetical protein
MGIALPFFFAKKDKPKKAAAAKPRALTPQDIELVKGLEAVREELDGLHARFEHTTDEVLMDALIYERKAAELKYKYFHNQLKVKGTVCG